MVVDTDWVYGKYSVFSSRFFGGNMPNIQIKIGRSLNNWGVAKCDILLKDGKIVTDNFILTISNAYDSPENVKENTLLHEMIHIYDFFHFPEHFATIKNGIMRSNRTYDAHGNDVFIPMAEMINRHGYNISQYVTKDEKELSDYSEKTKKRFEKPFFLCYAEYFKEGQENLMFMCSQVTLDKIISTYSNEQYNRFAPDVLTVYKTTNIELRRNFSMTTGDKIRGYKTPMDKWFNLLSYLGLDETEPYKILNLKGNPMYENKNNKRVIHLTKNDLRNIILEAINELSDMNSETPTDGGNAVGTTLSPTKMSLSII